MKNNIFNVGLSEANISKFELCINSKFIPNFIEEAQLLKDKDQKIILFQMKKLKI